MASREPKLDSRTLRTARLLGLASAAPFAICAVGAWLLGDGPLAYWLLQAIMTYAAVILSFLGGIHWGLALKDPLADSRSFIISVAPPLLAWAALLMPMRLALALLAICYVTQLVVDMIRLRLPTWFRNLRAILTIIVVASLILALMAVLQ